VGLILSQSTGSLLLTIAYCPSDFTGAGAIVKVDLVKGGWTIVTKFPWPQAINDGCAGSAMDTPAYAVDKPSSTLFLDFVNDFGVLVTLDLTNGQTSAVSPSNDFFTGYENMALTGPTTLKGLSGTVSEDGFCENGCFGWSSMDTNSGQQQIMNNVPYKAVMDDTHLFDKSTNKFWFQASYPLTPAAYCNSDQTQLCLISIDGSSGKMLSTVFTNYTVYKFAGNLDSNGNVLAWLYGFENLCNNPYDDFLFARVNLNTGKATPLGCIPKNVIDQEDEWISDFSNDNPRPTLFATASGDGDSGMAQVILLSTNGSLVFTNSLPGLGEALGSASGIYWIWAVSFL